MGYGYYYYGYYFQYLLFMLPAIILVLWAQGLVKSRYRKYSRVNTTFRVTGREVAERILCANGINDVGIARINGQMTDNFNPKAKTIFLSEGVYDSTSIAAVGIAAHEAGHAVQHAVGYFPIKVRTAIVPVCNIGAGFGLPLCVVGCIFAFEPLVYIGLVLFSLATVFQLVTLPMEFNASRRALEFIGSSDLVTKEEYTGAKKMLTAAAMTYVAALAQSMLQLLYYIIRFTGNGRRD